MEPKVIKQNEYENIYLQTSTMALGRTEILEKPLEESKARIRHYFIFILMGCGDSILCRLPDEVNIWN